MFVHWENKYSVHYEQIDDQHRLLLWNFRKLHFALLHDMSETAVKSIIAEMKTFIEFHFVSEENMMHDVSYPDVMRHAKIHQRLLASLDSFIEGVFRHEYTAQNFLEFVHDWLINHIQNEDEKVGRFIAAAAKRPTAEQYYDHFHRRV